ncbi:MAG: hypothetical protein JXQ87_14630 [Bacteroidia bacterium]
MKNFIFSLITIYVSSCSPKSESNTNIHLDTTQKSIEKSVPKESIHVEASITNSLDTLSTTYMISADSINNLLWQFDELNTFSITNRFETNYIEGDFYGDGTEDLAVLVEKDDQIGLCIINQNNASSYYLFGQNDYIDNFGWADIFERVPTGDTLWSNYIDDFRDYKDVPDSEKVVLDYDALFLHAQESCGGGFIFWKNNKFNWLQQE